MKMNRRNVLIGLGTVVAGGGAALGTGAFSSVEADRSVELQTSGDSSALLTLTVESDTLASETNDKLVFDQTALNENAKTEFDPAFSVENDGAEDVGFYVEEDGDIEEGGILDFEDSSGDSIVQSGSGDGNQIDLDNSSEDVTVVVDLRGDDDDGSDLEGIDTVTLVASTDAHNQ